MVPHTNWAFTKEFTNGSRTGSRSKNGFQAFVVDYPNKMKLVQFVTQNHSAIKRSYIDRVLNPNWPKHKAAEIAKEYGFEYWDGDIGGVV